MRSMEAAEELSCSSLAFPSPRLQLQLRSSNGQRVMTHLEDSPTSSQEVAPRLCRQEQLAKCAA